MIRLSSRLFVQIRRLVAPALAVWTVAWLTLGDRTGFLALLNAFTFWGLVASLPVTIILGRYPGGTSAPLAALLALLGLTTRYRRILSPNPKSTIQNPKSLRLLTFNLLKTDRDLAPVFAMLEREAPDIAVFQEVTPALAARLEAGLADRFPFRHWQPYHLVTDVSDDIASLLSSNARFKISVFARELDALLRAGYTRSGDYLVPPQ